MKKKQSFIFLQSHFIEDILYKKNAVHPFKTFHNFILLSLVYSQIHEFIIILLSNLFHSLLTKIEIFFHITLEKFSFMNQKLNKKLETISVYRNNSYIQNEISQIKRPMPQVPYSFWKRSLSLISIGILYTVQMLTQINIYVTFKYHSILCKCNAANFRDEQNHVSANFISIGAAIAFF